MTKDQLTKAISSSTGINQNTCSIIIQELFDNIIQTLKMGDKVSLRGFGTFNTKIMNERTYTTIHNNICTVPEHRTPFFKPSKEFVLIVKQNN